MSEESYEGVPREKIPWNPKIDYEKCITCGKCVDFCHVGAFRIEEKDGQKRTVVNPDKCIVFCSKRSNSRILDCENLEHPPVSSSVITNFP